MSRIRISLFIVGVIVCLTGSLFAQEKTIVRNAHYIGNRPPLLPSPLIKLPIGSITPKGWLRNQLELMANGMTGRLREISEWLRDDSGWLTMKKRGWEEEPYWLKGFGDLGYVLKDERIIKEARRWLEAALASQQDDGYFGPPENKKNDDLWPNMVMLFALQSYYEFSGDKRVLPFMTRYFQFEKNLPRERLLPGSWQKIRGGDNLESIYWLYNRTGDPELLEAAKAVYEQTADWTSTLPTRHGVNICQSFRQPGVFYQQSKDPKHLEAVERNYRTVMDEYGQVPGGMFAADENFRKGFTGASQGAETCSMVEFMYSNESLLKITGDLKYADRCEHIAFNSFPAAYAPDWKGIHYLTAPNLVQCDKGGEHIFQNGGKLLSYSPFRDYRCCQHNVAQGWPYFSEHLWMATQGNGLATVFYAPCDVKARVSSGAEVTIHEYTRYPFGDSVELVFDCPNAVRFPLALRIPDWCDSARLSINGEAQQTKAEPQSFLVVEREWKGGDRVRLELPMRITLSVWKKVGNSVSVNRGPLTFSLKIGEKWQPFGKNLEWPEFEVFPTTPWNYGLIVDRNKPEAAFEVIEHSWVPYQPFEAESAPILLRAKARRIPSWTLVKNCAGDVPPSPIASDQPVEPITLIPMGCAHLRISSFPTVAE
jgi:hypothetical protein